MAEKVGMLHDPETLKSLAKQLREEADRCEARAGAVKQGTLAASLSGCAPGCWQILSTCIRIQPL